MVRMMFSKNGRVIVYTDGACSRNGYSNAAAGYGVVFGMNHPWNYYSAVDGKPTNNVAEIEGATYAINFLGDKDFQSVSLRTDSKFLVTSYYQYMDTWIENDWIRSNGSPVKNREQFEDLNAAIEYHNMDVVFLHVAAHSGNRFNDEADRLASFGVEEYRERYH